MKRCFMFPSYNDSVGLNATPYHCKYSHEYLYAYAARIILKITFKLVRTIKKMINKPTVYDEHNSDY